MINPEKVQFFEDMAAQHLSLTFDDVRAETCSGREAPLPEVIDISSRFSTNVELKVPFVSAAMDTVTGGDMAIAMAKLGGIGVIHSVMTIDQQRKEVRRVKLEVNAIVDEPIPVAETDTLRQIINMRKAQKYKFETFPVMDADGSFVGMLTSSDFVFAESLDETVGSAMTPRGRIIEATVGTTREEAYRIMRNNNIKTLPLLNDDNRTIGGLYVFSDVSRMHRELGQYNIDEHTGQLRVAAAVTTGEDTMDRVEALSKYADVIVIDTADGDSYYAFQTLKNIKENYPDVEVVIGNISTGKSARELAEAGADGIKVGQGPGSICSTRRETGIGKPQVTAVYECYSALGDKFAHVPVCADGGIRYHGDLPIVVAAGASSIMMGRMFAGTTEAPGEIISLTDGSRVKIYRGMGSAEALQDNKSSRERYDADDSGLFLAEGVISKVPYEGPVADVLGLCVLGLRKGMRYSKSPDLKSQRNNTTFTRITGAGLSESHPHSVDVIT